MIATFWFLIKTCIILAAFAFVISLGGTVSIDFNGYSLSMTVGIFVLIACIVIWCLSVIGRAIKVIVDIPQTLTEYNERRHHKKGLQALAYGLTAVAAGDARAATHYTKRVVKYFNHEDYGLSDLLTALTARLKGDEGQVRKSFHSLMLHKETSFLGLKGLLQTAIDKRDYRYARILAEKAYAQHPEQPWVIKTLYDLNVRTRQFEEAMPLLKKAEKKNVFDKDQITAHKAALLVGQGETAKAYKVNPSSLPIGLMMLDMWADQNKRRKSVNLIKKLWADNPHPSLMDYWIKYAPKKALTDPQTMAGWIESLYRYNADDASGALYAGEAFINIGQREHAKRFVKQAISQKPTIHAYQLMGQIDGDGGSAWANQLATAPHDKAWVCTKSGHVYKEWQLLTEDGYFNCVVWNYPESVDVKVDMITSPFLLAA